MRLSLVKVTFAFFALLLAGSLAGAQFQPQRSVEVLGVEYRPYYGRIVSGGRTVTAAPGVINYGEVESGVRVTKTLYASSSGYSHVYVQNVHPSYPWIFWSGDCCASQLTYVGDIVGSYVGTMVMTYIGEWQDQNGTHQEGGTIQWALKGSTTNKTPVEQPKICGSIVDVVERSVGEEIPVVGTDLSFFYSSSLAPEFSNNSPSVLAFSYNQESWVASLQRFYDVTNSRLFYGTGSYSGRNSTTLADGNLMVLHPDGIEAYVFSPSGKHLRTVTSLTGATKYTFLYDGNDRLIGIQNDYGLTTVLARDSNGFISQVTSPFGQVTSFGVDANGRFTSVTNPNGEVYSLTYKPGTGLLASFTKPSGSVTNFTYDTDGKLTKDLGAAGNFWALSIGSSGEIIQSSQMGRQTNYSSSSTMVGDNSRAVTRPEGLVEYYYESGNDVRNYNSIDDTYKARAEDERFGPLLLRPTSIHYKVSGVDRVTEISQVVDRGTGAGYFDYSSLLSTVTTGGRTTASVFDNVTKMTTTTSPLGVVSVLKINSHEQPIEVKLGSDVATTFSYNSSGQLQQSKQGTRNQLDYAYNSAGYLQKVTNALAQESSFLYDLSGRVVQSKFPDGRTISFAYDANGNIAGITPPGRPQHLFAFNSMDEIAAYTPPPLTGALNTSFAYNLDKQLTQILRPDGVAINYNYNSTTGLLSTVNFPAGNISYTYRPQSYQISNVASPYDINNSFTYYGNKIASESQRTTSTNVLNGRVSYAYDGSHRLITRTLQGNSSAVASYPVSISYNNDSQPTQIGAMALNYDSVSGRLTTSVVGQVSDQRTYDGFGSLQGYSSFYTPSGGIAQPLYSYALTRDLIGRISSKVETVLGETATYTYTYDAAGRLTQVLRNLVVDASYNYDSNGNRTSGYSNGASFNATYDNQDRLTSYNGKTYSYNSNGELASITSAAGTKNFVFDAMANLVEFTDLNGSVSVTTYDGLGRLSRKTENGVQKNRFLYDDQNRLIATVSGGLIGEEYVYGTQSHSPDYVNSYKTDIGRFRIIKDHLGSPRLVVNVDTGQVIQRVDYSDTGKIIRDTNSCWVHFGFAGGFRNQFTKFVKFGAREYDPETGRWISKDPILFNGGDTNLYGYVMNDPINLIDPSGNCPLCVVAGVAAFLYGSRTDTPGQADTEAEMVANLGATLIGGVRGAEVEQCPKTVGNSIKGYTRHGINQAISKDGVGVSPSAILQTMRNPTRVVEQPGGTKLYVGPNASVVVNQSGQVVTVRPQSSMGYRGK